MKIEITKFPDLKIITPDIWNDNRGYFFESYNQKKFEELGLPTNFVQDNESNSKMGALRGLHFQKQPHTQGKLVRVVNGEVMNVVVDLRKNSQTYKQFFSIILNEENKKFLWVPEGFANGYLTIKDAIYQYKCTNFYNKNTEAGILWNDSEIGIDWKFEKYNIGNPIISEKDKLLPLLKDSGIFF